jgi:hypothetical protein
MIDIKARYRNKLNKIIIEVWNGEKWLYVKTLSNPLKEFEAECLAKVSPNKAENGEKSPQTFAKCLLTERLNKDTKREFMKPVDDLLEDVLGRKQ